MLGELRQRIRQWWLGRHPRSDSATLTQRNIYILPTRGGLTFCVTLFVMLVASINFRLNLGYVLIFLLAGAGLVSMHITHNTLRGLTMQLRPPAPGFAGDALPVDVVLWSADRERLGLSVSFDEPLPAEARQLIHVDLARGGQQMITLSATAPRRGLHEMAAIVVETRFPFGLFRAWSVWRPASRLLAWPAPEIPTPAWPTPPQATQGDGRVQAIRDGGEWEGVRAWRRGDPMKRLVWKKVARTGELVSRETSSVESREIWFDYQSTQGQDAESRLSRLSAWIVAAHAEGLPHGLKLPGLILEPEVSDAHRRRELDALATF